MGQVRISHGAGDVLEREASVLEFIYGKREDGGGCNSMGQSSGCVLHSDPACSSSGGRPFWTGEDPHFEKVERSQPRLFCNHSNFLVFTHLHTDSPSTSRFVSWRYCRRKKAKASLNLEESRSGGYSSVYGPVRQWSLRYWRKHHETTDCMFPGFLILPIVEASEVSCWWGAHLHQLFPPLCCASFYLLLLLPLPLSTRHFVMPIAISCYGHSAGRREQQAHMKAVRWVYGCCFVNGTCGNAEFNLLSS